MIVTLQYMTLLTVIVLGVSMVLSAIIVFVPYGLWLVGGGAMLAGVYIIAKEMQPC